MDDNKKTNERKLIFPEITLEDIRKSPGGANMELVINYSIDNGNHIITGSAGSGKTTIALLKAAFLEKQGKKTIFFVFNNLLLTYLKSATYGYSPDKIHAFYQWYSDNFKGAMFSKSTEESIRNNFEQYVADPTHDKFDAIIIDEGQDLPSRLYSNLNLIAKCVIVCADDGQISNFEDFSTLEEIKNCLENESGEVDSFCLTHNFRNTKEIYSFAIQTISGIKKEDEETYLLGIKSQPDSIPLVFKCKDEEQEKQKILDIVKENVNYKIAISFNRQEQAEEIYQYLTEKDVECSIHYGDRQGGRRIIDPSKMISPIIMTYRSSRGLDFDMVVAGMMLPLDDENVLKRFKDAELSEEEKVKKNKDELEKDLYVVFSRPKKKLFITYSGDQMPPVIKDIDAKYYKHEKVNE